MWNDLASTTEVDGDAAFNIHTDWISLIDFRVMRCQRFFNLCSRVNLLCVLCTQAALLPQPSLSSIRSCGDLFSHLYPWLISVCWSRGKAVSLLLCSQVSSDWKKDGEQWRGEECFGFFEASREKNDLHCEKGSYNPIPIPALYSRFNQFVLQAFSPLSNAQTMLLLLYKFSLKQVRATDFNPCGVFTW